MQLKTRCIPMGIAVIAVIGGLAACGQEREPGEKRPAVSPVAGESPPAPHGGEVAGTVPAPADVLPATRQLEVLVEGQRELRQGTLFQSPQGYAIYVLPQVQMTPEEPCCDLAYARVDDGFFMRIERIDDGLDLATLRENMQLGLSSVGPSNEVDHQAYFPAGTGAGVELAMRAAGDDVSMVMLLVRLDGGRFRVTQHLPHREALEGIAPSFRAMLGSLRVTGPRPEV